MKIELSEANKLKKVLESKGMTVFTKDYDMTLGGIRNVTDNKKDRFDDYVFMMYHVAGKLHCEMFQATTLSGIHYLRNPMNPAGTAIVAHDVQHISCYQLQDKGHRGSKAFRQVADMVYYRDNNKNDTADFGGVNNRIKGNFLTNLHRAGNWSILVGRNSAGCQVVARLKSLYRMFTLAQYQIENGHGDKFSYALITNREIDFII
jgi:hypothetical protein